MTIAIPTSSPRLRVAGNVSRYAMITFVALTLRIVILGIIAVTTRTSYVGSLLHVRY